MEARILQVEYKIMNKSVYKMVSRIQKRLTKIHRFATFWTTVHADCWFRLGHDRLLIPDSFLIPGIVSKFGHKHPKNEDKSRLTIGRPWTVLRNRWHWETMEHVDKTHSIEIEQSGYSSPHVEP